MIAVIAHSTMDPGTVRGRGRGRGEGWRGNFHPRGSRGHAPASRGAALPKGPSTTSHTPNHTMPLSSHPTATARPPPAAARTNTSNESLATNMALLDKVIGHLRVPQMAYSPGTITTGEHSSPEASPNRYLIDLQDTWLRNDLPVQFLPLLSVTPTPGLLRPEDSITWTLRQLFPVSTELPAPTEDGNELHAWSQQMPLNFVVLAPPPKGISFYPHRPSNGDHLMPLAFALPTILFYRSKYGYYQPMANSPHQTSSGTAEEFPQRFYHYVETSPLLVALLAHSNSMNGKK